MTGREIISLLLLTGAILVAACRRDSLSGDGEGRIVLSLNSSHALRMETKTPAEDLLDGSRFDNLLVILTDNSGKVVSTFYKDDYATPQTQDEVEFNHLLPGNYHAYAYANIDATQWQQTGANVISSKEGALSAGDSFSTFIDRELLGLTTAGRDAPVSPVTSMLLTGKMDIPVGLSVVETEMNLIRPVVRFKVTVRNNTRFPVDVNNLEFSHFNPDKAFLLDHLNASGVPAVPDGVTYRELPAFDSSDPSATVAAMSTGTVYTTYLYENVAPSTYKIFATVTLDRSGESLTDLSFTLGERPLGPLDLPTLNAMEDGETVKVLIVNPRKTTRAGRLFYGIGDTNIAWESFGYTSFANFEARARAIYQENSAHEYYGFTYNGFGNSQSGLAKWTGNAADAPVTETNPSTHKVVFDYTGARSTHFRRMTKLGGKFTIDGLTTNPPGGTSITDLKIVAGKIISGRFPDDIQAKYLLQFVNDNALDANYGKYLKASNAYGASSMDAAKVCPLSWESAGQSEHDHQFVLFGKFDDLGAALKRILKDNNKEVPLTYMARNEEINVILNVFYSDQEGSLVFEVNNDYWTDGSATESNHTFN